MAEILGISGFSKLVSSSKAVYQNADHAGWMIFEEFHHFPQ